MAFDFNNVKTDDKTLAEMAKDSYKRLLEQWQKTTDAAKDRSVGLTGKEFLTERGYFTANDYFMLQPYEYFDNTLCGGKEIQFSAKSNCIVVELNHDKSLDVSVEIPKSLEPENRPVLVFQYHHGEIEVKDEEIHPFDYRKFNCTNDLMVFRGVFKAIPVDDSKYRLAKVWERYYF